MLVIAGIVLNFFAGIIVESKIPKTISTSDIKSHYLDHYERYSNELNHLGGLNLLEDLPKDLVSQNTILYVKLGEGSKRILIQGDSWAEALATNLKSRILVEEFTKGFDSEIFLAGIGSYSPSIFSAQLRVLDRDFGIKPDYVVAVVDQTDIGDELCRYKSLRSIERNGEVSVATFSPAQRYEYFNLQNHLKTMRVLGSDSFNSHKIFQLALGNLRAQPQRPTCNWSAIQSYLEKEITDLDKNYFIEIIHDYVSKVFSQDKTKKLLFVTSPHKRHLTLEYKTDVKDLILEAIKSHPAHNRITLLDLKTSIQDKIKEVSMHSIYKENDVASHLSDEYHSKILTLTLMSELSNMLGP